MQLVKGSESCDQVSCERNLITYCKLSFLLLVLQLWNTHLGASLYLKSIPGDMRILILACGGQILMVCPVLATSSHLGPFL